MTKKSQGVLQSVKPVPSQDETPDKLTAIRELLYGEEVARLEAVIAEEHKTFDMRLSSLESLIKTTSQNIEREIKSAVSTLNNALDKSHVEHVRHEDELEQKLVDFNERLQKFQSHTKHDLSEAHNELEQVAKEIYKSLEKEVKVLTNKIDKTSQELGSNKADRKTLASLLESMATNLTQS